VIVLLLKFLLGNPDFGEVFGLFSFLAHLFFSLLLVFSHDFVHVHLVLPSFDHFLCRFGVLIHLDLQLKFMLCQSSLICETIFHILHAFRSLLGPSTRQNLLPSLLGIVQSLAIIVFHLLLEYFTQAHLLEIIFFSLHSRNLSFITQTMLEVVSLDLFHLLYFLAIRSMPVKRLLHCLLEVRAIHRVLHTVFTRPERLPLIRLLHRLVLCKY